MDIDYKRIISDCARAKRFAAMGKHAGPEALQTLIDALINGLGWPDNAWSRPTKRQQVPEDQGWFIPREDGEAECSVRFTVGEKLIEMTLVVSPAEEPRVWKVQYFSKDTRVTPDDDGSLGEFVRNAAQELRRRALDAAREG